MSISNFIVFEESTVHNDQSVKQSIELTIHGKESVTIKDSGNIEKLTGNMLSIRVGSTTHDPETWVPTNKYVLAKGRNVLIYVLNDVVHMDVTLLGNNPETIRLSKT